MSDKGRIVHISNETIETPSWQILLFFGTVAFGASVGWHLGSELFGAIKEITK